jgi:dTDP-4-amino-4,6-dideoxygalactose transaminase
MPGFDSRRNPVTDSVAPYANPARPEHGSLARGVRADEGRVPLMDPHRTYEAWGPRAEAAVLDILRSHVYVKGPHVAAFEAEFAAFVGVRRAVTLDSCTDALTLTLKAVLARKPRGRREVILPAFTFVATASAVVNAGGVPVFADVEEDTQNLDASSVARRLSRRTAAIIPVHLFGSPARMGAIREAVQAAGAGSRNVFLLEDAAQAVHAEQGGRRAGALGDAGAFSFYPSKNLGGPGDGGILTTDDEDLADRVACLRDHGQTRKMYDHTHVGTNSRMDEIQAAVLRIKLPHLEAWTRQRRAIAARYDLAFQGTDIRPQRVSPESVSAYHLYTVRLPERDAVRRTLEERGIGTGVYYPLPLHRQTCFAAWRPAPCPTADRLAEQVLSLPIFPGMTRPEQDRVIEEVRRRVVG